MVRNDSPYLHWTEAVKMLDVSRGKYFNLLRDGEIAHIKIGNEYKVTPENIKEFLDRQFRPARAS